MKNSSKNIKVLHIPNYSKNNPYQNNLVEGLSQYGIDAHINDIYTRGHKFDAISHLGEFDIIHIHWVNPVFFSGDLPRSIVRANLLLREIKALKKKNMRFVWTIHNIWHHEKKWHTLEKYVRIKLAELVDLIIVHCNEAKNLVISNYELNQSIKSKIHVIPHVNYNENYENTISREQARAELNIPHDSFVYLYFGFIRKYKGIINLIESFKKLNQPKSHLIITGKAFNTDIIDEITELSKGSENISIFPGFIENEQFQTYLNASDIVVLPFGHILTSGSAVLAMSFHKSVIAPDIGCIKEQLDGTGLMYNQHKPDALFLAMEKAYSQLTSTLGEKAYQHISKYSIEQTGKILGNLYEKIL